MRRITITVEEYDPETLVRCASALVVDENLFKSCYSKDALLNIVETLKKTVRKQFIKDQAEQKRMDRANAEELYNADPDCEHNIVSASGGGVKCTKCNGWYCL